MGETREELLARLAQLNETESFQPTREPEPKPPKFRTMTFGDTAVEIEIRPFVQPENRPDSDPETFKIGSRTNEPAIDKPYRIRDGRVRAK
jgi:hypothetical protein